MRRPRPLASARSMGAAVALLCAALPRVGYVQETAAVQATSGAPAEDVAASSDDLQARVAPVAL
jgi:hypothetical protein